MPESIAPMLCTLVRKPVAGPGYIHEVKWDGYRIISYVSKKEVRMDSRSSINYTKKYPPIVEALRALPAEVVLDGEVVVLNAENQPDFDALQKFNGHSSPIYYYVFDILWKDGENLMGLPLTERRRILQELVGDNDVIRFSAGFEDGEELFAKMQEMGMEGIVSKRADSLYHPGERAGNWLKTPTTIRQEFVIGGWMESERGRPFASLLFGAYGKNGFEWIGHGGGGFKEKEMPGILKKLEALETKTTPFVNEVDYDGVVHWVKPELVANFQFATWTKSGRIRKPAIFQGFRADKKAKDVVREVPASLLMAILALYCRQNLQSPIRFYSTDLMTLAKISARATYIKCIHDLNEYGYINYESSFYAKVASKIFLKEPI